MRKSMWLIPLAFLCACDASRIYEKNHDLSGGVWLKDSLQHFHFEIADAALKYNLYANVRNAHDYTFYNLYYQYALSDPTGNVLAEKLENIHLFDPKTGEPFGDGLGDVFDHRQLILEDFRFPREGDYTISLQQFMRQDTLPSILSVGIRVELAGRE